MGGGTYRHEGLFQQDGLQSGVQELPDVLTQNGHSDPDTVLQRSEELSVGQLDDLQPVLGLLVPDPAVGLQRHCIGINNCTIHRVTP